MCMKVPIVKAPEVGKFLNFGKKRKRRQLDEPFDLEDDDFEKAFQKLALANKNYHSKNNNNHQNNNQARDRNNNQVTIFRIVNRR